MNNVSLMNVRPVNTFSGGRAYEENKRGGSKDTEGLMDDWPSAVQYSVYLTTYCVMMLLHERELHQMWIIPQLEIVPWNTNPCSPINIHDKSLHVRVLTELCVLFRDFIIHIIFLVSTMTNKKLDRVNTLHTLQYTVDGSRPCCSLDRWYLYICVEAALSLGHDVDESPALIQDALTLYGNDAINHFQQRYWQHAGMFSQSHKGGSRVQLFPTERPARKQTYSSGYKTQRQRGKTAAAVKLRWDDTSSDLQAHTAHGLPTAPVEATMKRKINGTAGSSIRW